MRVSFHVDFELSPRVKRIIKIATPALVLLVGGVAIANVPHAFNDGDVLTAQSLNDNFTNLDTRVAALEALSGKGGDGGTVGSGFVVWKDTTGAVMPVVRVAGEASSGGWPSAFEIMDPATQSIWQWGLYSPVQGPYEALNAGNGPAQRVWITADCTGTTYVASLPEHGYAFHLSNDASTFYKIPDTVQVVQGAFASSMGNQGCFAGGGSTFLVPLTSLVKVTPPTAPPGVPPYHPEIVP